MTVLEKVAKELNAKESDRFWSGNILHNFKVYEFPYENGTMYFSDYASNLYSEPVDDALFFYWERYHEGMKYSMRFTTPNQSIDSVGIDTVLKMGEYDIKKYNK